jgi:hypothetical protein
MIFVIFAILIPAFISAYGTAYGAVIDYKDFKHGINTSLPFIENIGQIPNKDVAFYIETINGTIYVTKNGDIVYKILKNNKNSWQNTENGWVLVEKLTNNSKIPDIIGSIPSLSNIYFHKTENFKPKTFDVISLGEVYKGIELRLQANNHGVEKLFYISPEADVSDINIEIDGADSLKIMKSSELQISTGIGKVKFSNPIAYQIIDGNIKYVSAAYIIKGNTYGFNVGNYDRTKELIIDPVMSSTLIGSSGSERLQSITIDQKGDIFIVGFTSANDFPVIAGAYGIKQKGNQDVFISKFNKDLTKLIASTYFGGSNDDFPKSSAIYKNGSIYVTGYTSSTDIPTSTKAVGQSNKGNYDIFICRLSNDLSSLEFSTYLGGESHDYPVAIAINPSGYLYVAGYTSSTDFPVTKDSYNPTHNGNYDIFVSRLSLDLTTLMDSTFIGGEGRDQAANIAIDNDKDIYLTGTTYSANFPTTHGTFNTKPKGISDVVVMKMSFDLKSLIYSTIIGGKNKDSASSIIIDGKNIFVAGITESNDFPVTRETFDPTFNGQSDIFIIRLNPALSEITASTLIGGSGKDEVKSALIDGTGNIFIAGITDSPNYPVTDNGYNIKYNGNTDVFVSRLDRNLKTVIASTFIGGKSQDLLDDMTIDIDGNVYIAGTTNSSDFIVSPTAYDKTLNGVDGFVMKFNGNLSQDGQASAKIVLYKPEKNNKIDAPNTEENKTKSPDLQSLPHPVIVIHDTSKPFDDRIVNFGAINKGESKKMTVTITNKGTKELSIGKISGNSPIRNPFMLLSDNCSNKTFEPERECRLTISYSPGMIGSDASEFDIPSNDLGGTVQVKLTGKSILYVNPSLEILDTAAPFNDHKLPFGIVTANTPTEHSVTLKNIGKKDIAIGQIAQKNALKEPFSIASENCSGITLKPTDSCTVTVRFLSAEKGTFVGDFDIPFTGAGQNNVTIHLSGLTGSLGSYLEITPQKILVMKFGDMLNALF